MQSTLPDRLDDIDRYLPLLAYGLLFLSLLASLITDSFYPALSIIPLYLGFSLRYGFSFWWFVIVFVTPFSFELVVPGMDSALQIPTEPLIFGLLVCWGLSILFQSQITLHWSPLHLPLFVLFILICVSVVKAPVPLISVKAVANFLWYVLIGYWFVVHLVRQQWQIQFLAASFVMLAVAMVIIGALQLHLFYSGYLPQRQIIPDLFFSEHGTYAAYLTFGFAIAFSYALYPVRQTSRWLYALAALIILYGIVFSYTRAAWVSMLIIIPLMIWLQVFPTRRFGQVLLMTMVIIGAAVIFYQMFFTHSIQYYFSTIFTPRENFSALERLNRWMTGLNMMADNPILGVGYGNYIESYFHYKSLVFETPFSNDRMGIHHEFLKIGAEAGIPAFGVFIWLLGSAVYRGLRHLKTAVQYHQRCLLLGFLAGLTGYAVQGFFNEFLAYDKVAIPFWVSLGVISVYLSNGPES